jgi:hypothetical protein
MPLHTGHGPAVLPTEFIAAPGPIPKILRENHSVPHLGVSQITGIAAPIFFSVWC